LHRVTDAADPLCTAAHHFYQLSRQSVVRCVLRSIEWRPERGPLAADNRVLLERTQR
jgi:hypothetical protein